MDFAKLDALLENSREDMIRTLCGWIAIPSVSARSDAAGAPFGAECRRALDLALADAKAMGFSVRDFDGYAGDITLEAGEKTLGMLCHLDVVPAGDGWTKQPFGGEIEAGKIYGRGTMDDKGPAVAALYAMKAVRDAGIPLKDSVRLILGCDEETGMSDMRYYAAHTQTPDYGFSPDAEYPVINIEKGGLGVLLTKELPSDAGKVPLYEMNAGVRPNVVPGIAWAIVGASAEEAAASGLAVEDLGNGRVKLTAAGVSAHASTPQLGVNAIGLLFAGLVKIGAGGETIRALSECIGLEGDGKSLGIAIEDEESGQLTCNMGILRYDGRFLSVQLDIRYPIAAEEEKMLGQMAMKLSPARIGVTRLSGHGPHHVPKEHRLVRELIAAYSEVTGKEGYAFAIGGGTYSRMMPNTVAFGINFPGDVDTCHMPDEYVELDKWILSARIMAHAIARLAGAEQGDE